MPDQPPQGPVPLPRVLVVDDAPDSLWLIKQLLEGRYQVLQASSGREALALASADPPPDLMLLDIVMPDMDGYEVLRRLRQQPRTAGIPVAFMTSLTAAEQQSLGRELGAVDYLTKPVDVRAVISRVEAHVSVRQQARRMEVLGERLARYVSPDQWSALFHGGAGAIAFEQVPVCLLLVQAARLNGSARERALFTEEIAALAAEQGGTLDRFEREATVLIFDQPAAALRTARILGKRHEPGAVQLGLHDMQAELAYFSCCDSRQRTLLGDEAQAARQATLAHHVPIAISPAAYAALRGELQACDDATLFTARYNGVAPELTQLVALAPARVRAPGPQALEKPIS